MFPDNSIYKEDFFMSSEAIEALCEVALKILDIDFINPISEVFIALLDKIDLNQVVQFVLGLIGK